MYQNQPICKIFIRFSLKINKILQKIYHKRQTPNAERQTLNAKRQTPNLGPFGVWRLMPPSLWELRGASGSLWQPLGASGSLWEPLAASGSFWEPLAASGSTPNAKRQTLNAKRQTPNMGPFGIWRLVPPQPLGASWSFNLPKYIKNLFWEAPTKKNHTPIHSNKQGYFQLSATSAEA
jgi:hypothetical protein